MRTKLGLVGLALVIGTISSLAAVAPAAASTFTPGCSVGSLRSAFNSAEAVTGPHTVVLPAGCTYRFTNVDPTGGPDNALPVLTRDVTVEGNGATFERGAGAPSMRFIEMTGGDTLTLRNLTLRRGLNPLPDAAVWDAVYGAGSNGGALRCIAAELVLEDVILEENTALNGGAVFTEGCDVTITRTTFSYNRASDGDGGGLLQIGRGGGPLGALFITDSTFEDNEAEDDGGGILGEVSYTEITGSSFRRNVAADEGGGLSIASIGSPQEFGVTIEYTTISRNSAGDIGGGLVTSWAAPTAVRYSSIWGNTADGGAGISWAGDGEVVMSTISGNTANLVGGGMYQPNQEPITLNRATIANNVSLTGIGNAIASAGNIDMFNTLIAYTGALPAGTLCITLAPVVIYEVGSISEGDCFNATNVGAGGAWLGPLAQNGGLTRTHPIGWLSPAYNGGDAAFCDAGPDQRGDPYVGSYSMSCDVGAFEFQLFATPYEGPLGP